MRTLRQVCKDALRHFGGAKQCTKTIEECNELALVLAHYADKRACAAEVASEIADVLIMCEAMTQAIGRDLVTAALASKLDRLDRRIATERALAERNATL